ncbi:hypothetical protein AJ79_00086 [Helicocarpus griseus UAMH5409]|uniref:Uncharacterized protein n=1 Tax=Helicocarpus griseus UAMH5409 TaxID=1447875 RepID=A0A2B7YDU7_9EURO|nr:hypothetical protein AJ79_00086 [Helicocarpus griseus UAMH5409]
MASTISYHNHNHILSPTPSKPKSTLINGTGTGTTLSASALTQEISRAMQASSSQLPKYASYSYMEERGEHPPPPPPSPVGFPRS